MHRDGSQGHEWVWLAGVPLLAVLLWVLFPSTYPGFQETYSLLWGDDIAHGRSPDYEVRSADTPHPLPNAIGVLLSPLGDGRDYAISALNYLSLAAMALALAMIARRFYGWPVAVAAGVLVLTRVSFVALGVSTYYDPLYAALLLGCAYLIVTRERPVGSVLALLAVAGLIRPEAWAFSVLYASFLVLTADRPDRRRLALRLAPVTFVAPLIWIASDWVLAGDPLHSFTYTREFALQLERETGLIRGIQLLPTRITDQTSKIMLALAVPGAVLVALRRRRVDFLLLGLFALIVAMFLGLAALGFSIVGRYLIIAALLALLFVAVLMFGWTSEHAARRRRALLAAGVAALAVTALWVPEWVDALRDVRTGLVEQEAAYEDLRALADSGELAGCGAVYVPSLRQAPHIALWTGRPHDEILNSAFERDPRSGLVVTPRDDELRGLLQREMGTAAPFTAPPGFERSAENASWIVWSRCPA